MNEAAADGGGNQGDTKPGHHDGHHACHARPPAPSWLRDGHRLAQSPFGARHRLLIAGSILKYRYQAALKL
jgi:hypothetical protein